MSVMNKPDYKIFAQDAKSGEYVAFPDILRGWGITLEQYNGFPPMELFNSAAKRIDEWLMYLTQRGLPEWDAAVDYPKDAMTQHAGVYYVSLKVTKGEQPNNSQASWQKLTEFLGVDKKLDKASVVQNTGASTTSVMSQKSVTDELNKKFDKTGGTITGSVTIQSADDFPTLNLLGNNGDSTRVQANTSDPDYMLTIVARDSTGKVKKTVRIPNKDGTALLSGEVYSNEEINNLIAGVKNTALKQAAGWHKDESTGVITQWGEVNKINDSQPYIMQFPIPFPTAVTAIVTQVISNETGVLNITPRIRTPSTTRTQFAIQHGVSEGRYYWIAKGY
ncbi:gp53-like domain-containing protein [Morganella morganii]|uniref:gp53-like domain-containing protein n=1 Tax=Morganella morganii TaxID=582 RepID=UPI001147733B|nr:hypothetical protein [Morganella morganii]